MAIKAFIAAVKPIISLGASTNAACREEITKAVGSLNDELIRALDLVDSHLVGAKFSIDDNELSRYLAHTDGTLMTSFKEFHICASLYSLADKFDQIFSPIKLSVNVANLAEIKNLIKELANGEKIIIDDLQDILNELRNYSSQLHSGVTIREDVLLAIETHRREINRHKSLIKSKYREILKKL